MDVGESGCSTDGRERIALVVGPSVARKAGRARTRSVLDDDEPATGLEQAKYLGYRPVEIGPVVHRRERPRDSRTAIGERERLGRSLEVRDAVTAAEPPRDPEHDSCRIDARGAGTNAGRTAHRGSRSASDVDDVVGRVQPGQVDRERRFGLASDCHAQCGSEAGQAGEPGVMGVMVRDFVGVRVGRHATDLDS